MIGLRGEAIEYAKTIGSGMLHAAPEPLRGFVARHYLGLPNSNDRLLRWRVARYVTPSSMWVKLPASGNANPFDPSEWENVVLGVSRRTWEDEMGSGRRPAVAYWTGTLAVVGVRQLDPRDEILSPINEQGVPDTDARMMGVVLRAGGEGLAAAIGTTMVNGKYFSPLPTKAVSRVEVVARGLYRV